MAVTLIINPGSSSKKYALYEGDSLRLSAHIEHDAGGIVVCTSINGTSDRCETMSRQIYEVSLLDFIERALNEKIISEIGEIETVGIRIVAPGTFFAAHRLVDDQYLEKLQAAVPQAPLHIPATLKELKVLRSALPEVKVVAVSDSAFHSTLSPQAHNYSLPPADVKALDLYRFGYHGLSIASVVRQREKLGLSSEAKFIVCHLGSGVSVTAVKAGKSVDTTMGYAPGSGLIMGSRAGDLDSGALLALMRARNLSVNDADLYLQTSGGLRGFAGESDLRQLLERQAQGDKAATLAVSSFVYQIQKAIGAYLAILGGVEAIIFTATAGERSAILRELVAGPLAPLGIWLDPEKNNQPINSGAIISQAESPIMIAVVRSAEATEILHTTTNISEN